MFRVCYTQKTGLSKGLVADCEWLTNKEFYELVTNCDRFNTLKHSTSFPYVFTEQGVAMLSAVLHSPTAIQVSIKIMDAFVKLRHIVQNKLATNDFESELQEIRRLLLLHIEHCDMRFNEQNERINQVIKVLNNLIKTPSNKEKIGFKGE